MKEQYEEQLNTAEEVSQNYTRSVYASLQAGSSVEHGVWSKYRGLVTSFETSNEAPIFRPRAILNGRLSLLVHLQLYNYQMRAEFKTVLGNGEQYLTAEDFEMKIRNIFEFR